MRVEKKQIVDELSKQVGASPFVLITDYTKRTVTEFAALRKKLRAAHAECHVVKNSMLRHAAKEAGLVEFDNVLAGMTAVVIGNAKADISAAAKILKQFTKDTEKGKVKLGVLGKERVQYWKLLIWTVVRRPSLLKQAITLAICGYHYRKVCEMHVLAK